MEEATNGPVKRDLTSYVSHYGKNGFITYD